MPELAPNWPPVGPITVAAPVAGSMRRSWSVAALMVQRLPSSVTARPSQSAMPAPRAPITISEPVAGVNHTSRDAPPPSSIPYNRAARGSHSRAPMLPPLATLVTVATPVAVLM